MTALALPCRPSLRLRIWIGAAGLCALTLSGAALAVVGLGLTERRAQEALAAQTRLEAWASLSTRFNEWMLTRYMQGGDADPAAVTGALERLDRLTAADVHDAPNEAEASRRAADIRHIAKMKSLFSQLRGLAPDTPAGQAGIVFHMTHAPGVITSRIEHETRRRDMAMQGMEDLRAPLRLALFALAVLGALVLWLLWRGTLRPILSGLSLASKELGRLSAEPALPHHGRHDELGLMFARLNQASARIARRRAQLESDLSELEAVVAARTEELARANRRLSAIDAARRRFFADVSHELRTPLTVILGEAELGAATADPETRQSFQTITLRAERLFRRIEDLLRIAGSESGELELERRPVALVEAIEAAAEDVAPLLRRAGVRLSRDVPQGLMVEADPDWLRQIFAGFFENAAKFAGSGATISVTAQEAGGRVLIHVVDDGAAPAPPLDAPLFDRHARHAAPSISGFGLGLALAHWAARALGGDLRRLPLDRGFGLELELTATGEPENGPYSHY